MRKIAWSITVMAGAALGVACATAAQDAPPEQKIASTETNLQDVDRFCQVRAEVECNELVVSKCQSSKDACVKARVASCAKSQPQGTKYLPKAADACIQAVKAMYADAKISADEKAAVDLACGPKIFSGPGAVRGPCSSPYDCSSEDGLTCVMGEAETSNGKCLRPVPVGPGESCKGESDSCPDNYYCDQTTKNCQIRASAGASCHITIKPCQKGLRCPPPSPFGNTCSKPFDPGQVCNLDSDCTGMCVKAAHQAQGVCAAAIELGPLADECGQFK